MLKTIIKNKTIKLICQAIYFQIIVGYNHIASKYIIKSSEVNAFKFLNIEEY